MCILNQVQAHLCCPGFMGSNTSFCLCGSFCVRVHYMSTESVVMCVIRVELYHQIVYMSTLFCYTILLFFFLNICRALSVAAEN